LNFRFSGHLSPRRRLPASGRGFHFHLSMTEPSETFIADLTDWQNRLFGYLASR
jgi:hypothetical protein